jgi:hypothetical protein
MVLPYARRISRDGIAILTEASGLEREPFEKARGLNAGPVASFCVAAIAWSILKRHTGEVTLLPNQATPVDGMKVIERQFEVPRQHSAARSCFKN